MEKREKKFEFTTDHEGDLIDFLTVMLNDKKVGGKFEIYYTGKEISLNAVKFLDIYTNFHVINENLLYVISFK